MFIVVFIFKMLLVFQIKHFLCDYPLQNEYMLGKFRKDWGFFWPLCAHAGVHALATYLIVCHFDQEEYDVQTVAIVLAMFDFICHFFMDRIKAGDRYLGRFKPLSAAEYKKSLKTDPYDLIHHKRRDNKFFWWALGFDQMVHHLTHYVIIFMMLMDKYGYVAK